ncbi:MAG: hypothetical protein V1859_00860 [archaeon]
MINIAGKQIQKKVIKRKAFHIVAGTKIVILSNLFSINLVLLSLGILLAAGLLVSIMCRKIKIPLISALLSELDKNEDINTFPGKGAFFFIAGCFFSLILFDLKTASASILILTFGDSVSHIVGRYFGKTKTPISKVKLLEGTVAGIIVATIAAGFFINFKIAFCAASVAMVIESIELKYLKIDDNLVMPLIAGAVISLL